MLEWMLMPYRRYADFSGRSRRKEYWMFVLFYLGIAVVLGGLGFALGASTDAATGSPTFNVLGYIILGALALLLLGSFIPALAVQVRRLHDQDRSGWWVLIGIIPIVNYIGGIVMLVFMCLEGTKGENRFGPDPKGAENLGDVFR